MEACPALGDGPAVLSFCPTAKKLSSRQGRRHLLLVAKATAKHDVVVLASRRTPLARRLDCSSMDQTPQALVPASVDDADDGLGDDVELVEGPLPKRAKLSKKGAAVYKSKFHDAWTKEFPFIRKVQSNRHSFFCTVCNREVSCSHMDKSDVERHVQKQFHKDNEKALRTQQKIPFTPEFSPLNEKARLTFYRN